MTEDTFQQTYQENEMIICYGGKNTEMAPIFLFVGFSKMLLPSSGIIFPSMSASVFPPVELELTMLEE